MKRRTEEEEEEEEEEEMRTFFKNQEEEEREEKLLRRRKERGRPKDQKFPKTFCLVVPQETRREKKFKKEKQFSSSPFKHTQRCSYCCPLFRIHTQEQQSTKNKNKND